MFGADIVDVTSVLPSTSDFWPQARMLWLIEHEREVRDRLVEQSEQGKRLPLSTVHLLPPVPVPRQVYALPGNFNAHLGELGSRSVSNLRTAREQGFFLKSAASISGPADPIQLPRASGRRYDHECEVAVVIGQTCRDVPASRAIEVAFGYMPLVDVTLRIERGEFEEERSMRKSFATFTPTGPALVTAQEVESLTGLVSRLRVNGQLRQEACLSDMIVDVNEAIELVSSVVELRPGDLIAMGTPAGVGPIAPGDLLEISIDELGSMRIPIQERDDVAPRAF
jgi:2-keto-4-pentenoate hydratase/2-oxohepta-3-ene-1,7-dioic acid hydratase in catechol pathway